MPAHNRSIGGAGLEQGGPNLGNDYSRDITREQTADDTDTPVIPHPEQPGQHKKKKDTPKDNAAKQHRETRHSPAYNEKRGGL